MFIVPEPAYSGFSQQVYEPALGPDSPDDAAEPKEAIFQ